jgi:hypothetical protein
MFHARKLTREGAIDRILELRARISPQRVGTAFLESLSSRQVGLRSALGSYQASSWILVRTTVTEMLRAATSQRESWAVG